MTPSKATLKALYFTVGITPEMEGYPTDENQAAAYMNKIIEKEIMRAPEQYLWIHRRFKTRPVGESSLYI
ncbi:hypothetical protein [Escherichia coli]|uniref:LpxL/LpxP family acyltransferase n=1 Tax=Escherichia coli TaxID=562 RepID=UPI0023B94141|nr:hypothetical protein [Escherichia coli]